MKISHILKKENAGILNCTECGGTGIILEEIVENSRVPRLSVCLCVREHCYVCPSNAKSPYLVYDEESDRMLPCFCHQSRIILSKIEAKINKSNIPPKYMYKFLESVDLKGAEALSLLAAHDWARDLVENFNDMTKNPQGMYLTGAPGTGKTLLACIILNELILRYGIDCRYAKINKDFLSALRNTYQKDSNFYGQEKNIEEEFAEVEVLVIDDFGVQKDTDWANSKLYDLIDARYEKQKLTLLTSNQPLIDWKEKGEGRVYSRLCEMAKEIKLECPDYRMKFLNAQR